MTGVRVEVTLTRLQAAAVLRAELSAGHGVRRSANLIDAERRLHAAVRLALEPESNPPRMRHEPGA
jgi:hypothetical protein